MANEPGFAQAQRDFAREAYFQPIARGLERATGVPSSQRSQAVVEALMSTSVQHGSSGGPAIMRAALAALPQDQPADDRALIQAIYAERLRPGTEGAILHHFRSSTPRVQQAVRNRLVRERDQLLAMLPAGTRQAQAPAGR